MSCSVGKGACVQSLKPTQWTENQFLQGDFGLAHRNHGPGPHTHMHTQIHVKKKVHF